MNNPEKETVLDLLRKAHAQVENIYLENPATKGSDAWQEKRRWLLADLGIHVVQAALQGDTVNIDRLQRSLFSVLTISHEFLPEVGLLAMADKLMADGKKTEV